MILIPTPTYMHYMYYHFTPNVNAAATSSKNKLNLDPKQPVISPFSSLLFRQHARLLPWMWEGRGCWICGCHHPICIFSGLVLMLYASALYTSLLRSSSATLWWPSVSPHSSSRTCLAGNIASAQLVQPTKQVMIKRSWISVSINIPTITMHYCHIKVIV